MKSQDLSGDGVATEGDEDREVGVLQLEAVHVRHQACNHVQGLLGDSGWIEDRLWDGLWELRWVGTMIIS